MQEAIVVLGRDLPLLCRLAQPLQGLAVRLIVAGVVAAQPVLRVRVPQFRRTCVVLKGLVSIRRRPATGGKHEAKVVMGARMIVVRRTREPVQRRVVIHVGTPANVIGHPHIEHGTRIAALGIAFANLVPDAEQLLLAFDLVVTIVLSLRHAGAEGQGQRQGERENRARNDRDMGLPHGDSGINAGYDHRPHPDHAQNGASGT